MNNDVLISVDRVSKIYKLYSSKRNRIKELLLKNQDFHDKFWALTDVSLTLRKGESLGLIGRNGSGKSTLLQMICGTLQPSKGSIEVHGRIGALLELGSGFNPEFTGLENIYLNAALIGIQRREVDEKLDQILGFADIGDFIHQPVKAYSSGMVVRLAFSVLAHVDADILVIDEALAVGDEIFVQRCMRFIRRFKEENCLLFVSHDLDAIRTLCDKSLWLKNGTVSAYGETKNVSLAYHNYCHATSHEDLEIENLGKFHNVEQQDENITSFGINEEKERDTISKLSHYSQAEVWTQANLDDATGWKTGRAQITSIDLNMLQPNLEPIENAKHLWAGSLVRLTITAAADTTIVDPIIGFTFKDRLGQCLFGENTLNAGRDLGINCPKALEEGNEYTASFDFYLPMLASGTYTVMASIAEGDLQEHVQHHWLEDALLVKVVNERLQYGVIGAFMLNAHFSLNTNGLPKHISIEADDEQTSNI